MGLFGKDREKQNQVDLEIFAIYDTKTSSYNVPSHAQNRHVLIRELENMMRDPSQASNMYFVNAEDFQVFKIGTYEKKSGLLVGCHPEHVANMHELKSMVMSQKMAGQGPVGVVGT